MKKLNKKIAVVSILGAALALNSVGFAFAADASQGAKQSGQQQTNAVQNGKGAQRGGEGRPGAGFGGRQNLEKLAAEKGVTVDELKAQMEQERQAQLEKLAAEKGVTVDELKAQMDNNRGPQGAKGGPGAGFGGGQNLEKLAAEKGVTVDELKAQLEQERQAQLEKLAAEKGVTVDELKAELEKNRGQRGGPGGPGAGKPANAAQQGASSTK